MRGRSVCRFHGGKAGAPTGERNGNFKFGLHTNEIVGLKREIAGIIRSARGLLKEI
jgi:hypothetical protein